MNASSVAWEEELERWLEPFRAGLNRAAQKHWMAVYLKGLVLPGERKSIEPMAARVAPGAVQQLHHFLSTSPWPAAPLEDELVRRADRLLGGPEALLVIDDTALPKQGTHSVGVARQYCGCLGKRANCQVLVSLTLAQGEVPLPIALRLFLPDAWIDDPGRCDDAAVPENRRRHLAKTDLALEELDRARALGARFGYAVTDAGYGLSAEFRQGLCERGLLWAAGIPRTQGVYPTTVMLAWPQAVTGRRRKHPVPDAPPIAAEAMLAPAVWRSVSWRRGTKGPLRAAFAAMRVRPAEGAPIRGGIHLPGKEVWLVGEHRPSGERKYYLSNLPADATLEQLAALIKAALGRPMPAVPAGPDRWLRHRWVCEQAHQQLKEELGLDHLECRSWRALHHHALLTMMAFAFLQQQRLGGKRCHKVNRSGTAAATDSPRGAPAYRRRVDRHRDPLSILPPPLRSLSSALKMAE